MDRIEALLRRKLDKLESEVFSLKNTKEPKVPQPHAAALLFKLSFLKYLLSAETGGNTACIRLNHIAARISSLESIFSGADDPEIETLALRPDILNKNLHELESMAKDNCCDQSAAIILRKIAFTKSLLAFQDPSEDLSSLSERISVVEKAFFHQSADYGRQASCSPTSRQAEEVGEENAFAFTFKKKTEEIENDVNIDDYDGIPIKLVYLGHFLTREMKCKGEDKAEELDGFFNRFSNMGNELADQNGLFDDAIGSNGSSSCSCTSTCLDKGEEMENEAEEEDTNVSTVSETEELSSLETEKVMEGKCETADSGGGDGGWRFGKLACGAMVGIFAVAAIGVVVGSLLSDKWMVNLVPT